MSCAEPPRPCASTAARRARSGSGPKRSTDCPAWGSSGFGGLLMGPWRSCPLLGLELHLDLVLLVVAQVGDGHFLAHLPALEREREVGARADGRSVDRDDDVAGQHVAARIASQRAQAGAVGG